MSDMWQQYFAEDLLILFILESSAVNDDHRASKPNPAVFNSLFHASVNA